MSTNSVAQSDIFEFLENTDLGDLNRYRLLMEELESIPEYQSLVFALRSERGNGRNDYPVEVMMRLYVVQNIFQLRDIADLRRELDRNSQLRKMVGLSDIGASLRRTNHHCVPSAEAFTHFSDKLVKHDSDLDQVFNALKGIVRTYVPDFGKNVAGDGKYYDSYCPNKHSRSCGDNRCEHDATYSKKVYNYIGEDGKPHQKVERHYGFRTQTLVDTKTELPVACIMKPANVDEKKAMTELFSTLSDEEIAGIITATLDRGYDARDFLNFLRGKGIKPVIDNRMMRKGDALRQYKKTSIYYAESGEVFMYDERIGDERIDQETGYQRYFQKMTYRGYDKIRKAVRYEYKGHVYRLLLKEDPRVFNDIGRDSRKFERIYNSRTSVERYHGRMDRDFCFEDHTIRNLQKMNLAVKMANIIMLGMGCLHMKLGQTNYASLYVI